MPAAAVPTASAAAQLSAYVSTWAIRAPEASRSPVGPTTPAKVSISATTPLQRVLQPRGSGQLSALLRVRGLVGHGELHAVGRDQQHLEQFLSRRQSPAAAARTISAAAASCRHPASTWAIPARGASRSRAGPTASALSLSRLQRRRQRHVQPQRQRPVVGVLRVRGLFRHGELHAVGRDQQHQQLSLSRQQRRRQRHVQPQRQRPVVGRRANTSATSPARRRRSSRPAARTRPRCCRSAAAAAIFSPAASCRSTAAC